MAFSEKQVRIILYSLPLADGSISLDDAGHILWVFRVPDLLIDVHDCTDLTETIGG